ncbi:MAG: PilZ domain-containing protein [Vicinamibacterales bacterium]|nr:PilZ domain-containing protein [Vicinamibacterales bacterium]
MADALERERRAWPRISTVEHLDIANGRLRPGRNATIVDVSEGGALVETDCRLLPGMRVELQIGEPVTRYRVKARILRCHVALLDRERIRYRGALAFDEQVQFGEGNDRPMGSSYARGDGSEGADGVGK